MKRRINVLAATLLLSFLVAGCDMNEEEEVPRIDPEGDQTSEYDAQPREYNADSDL